jgi:hypothetical protein
MCKKKCICAEQYKVLGVCAPDCQESKPKRSKFHPSSLPYEAIVFTVDFHFNRGLVTSSPLISRGASLEIGVEDINFVSNICVFDANFYL